jgi:hypothetical protein
MASIQKMYNAILAGGRRSVPTHDEVTKDMRSIEANIARSAELPF